MAHNDPDLADSYRYACPGKTLSPQVKRSRVFTSKVRPLFSGSLVFRALGPLRIAKVVPKELHCRAAIMRSTQSSSIAGGASLTRCNSRRRMASNRTTGCSSTITSPLLTRCSGLTRHHQVATDATEPTGACLCSCLVLLDEDETRCRILPS
jgi:hypothetical protein